MTKFINVYFNGTNDSNDVPEKGNISLATLLDHITINAESICVNGSGIENHDIRDLGIIFSFHLEKKVLKIAKGIEEKLDESEDNIVLNIYGYSRGGIAAFLLCQKLKDISKDRLTINVASFEPVPVNFITSVYGDILFSTNSTLSAAVADLGECKNIDNMLILFTNEPLPDIFGFAPILPALPTNCTAEIDVTPGRHQSAVSFYKKEESIQAQNTESVIVFHRIVEFMQKCGTTFDFERLQLDDNLVYPNQQLLNLYEDLAKKIVKNNARSMQLGNSIFTSAQEKYLNLKHQELDDVENINDRNCILTINDRNPQQISAQRRQLIQYIQTIFGIAMLLNIYAKYVNEPNVDRNNLLRPN